MEKSFFQWKCLGVKCLVLKFLSHEVSTIPTFGNPCLSLIGGEKQQSRLARWVQLSVEVAPGPHGVPPAPPCAHRGFRNDLVDKNIDDAGNLYEKRHCNSIVFFIYDDF